MSNTSVHLPDDLLDRLDREASRLGMSRNRLIVQACERALTLGPVKWPRDYFSDKRFARGELRELHDGFDQWMTAIQAGRRSRKSLPF